jgi:ribosomal protein S18 acetylase RimI-like enzyme
MVILMEKLIRNAQGEDKKALINLYLNDVEYNLERAEKFAMDLIYRLKTILCLVNDEVIGTVSWDTRGGLNDGVIEMIGLGVSPKYQRQGLAKLLVIALINEVKNYYKEAGYKLRVIYLFMERNNEVGRHFYKALGFREVCQVPELYPQDDATIWIKYF